jgi:transcriptional regulator with XRE-family HTH domain
VAAQRPLGEELRRLRVAAELTLEDLSARSRVRQEYLAAIEDNREEPSLPALRRIADQLDPAGAAHNRLAALLTSPEPDLTGRSHPNTAAPGATPAGVRADELRRLGSEAENEAATGIRDIWRHKTAWQVMVAADSIAEYSEQAQDAIRSEFAESAAGPGRVRPRRSRQRPACADSWNRLDCGG